MPLLVTQSSFLFVRAGSSSKSFHLALVRDAFVFVHRCLLHLTWREMAMALSFYSFILWLLGVYEVISAVLASHCSASDSTDNTD